MKSLSITLLFALLLSGCSRDPFEPFEFFYNVNGQKAVVISVLPGDSGIEMRTRVYPEDGELGLGEVAARDDTRVLTAQEATEIQRLFHAVEFSALDNDEYIPPLDASLWAVNTRETVDDYFTVLEPSEDTTGRNLVEFVALGTYLWELARLEGDRY